MAPPTRHHHNVHINRLRDTCSSFFVLYSLRPVDVEFMKRLHHCVNIVPVIGKSDTLTLEERDSFKMRIREDIRYNGINIYPSAYGAEDDEDAAINTKIEVRPRASKEIRPHPQQVYSE